MYNFFFTYLLLIGFCPLISLGQDGLLNTKPRIAYWCVGTEELTVIVIHGGPSVQHNYLRPEYDALALTSTVIYYDQRGCGLSERANSYKWQDHVFDLKRLITSVSKKKKVVLVGSSWGSMLSLLYAYTYPEDVAGLILSGLYLWQGKGTIYQSAREIIYNPMHQQLITEKRFIRNTNRLNCVSIDTALAKKILNVYSGTPMSETSLSFASAPVFDCLNALSAPVLLFTGSLLKKEDYSDKYKKVLKNSVLHEIPGAGHDPWLSNPELFFSISNEFIKGIYKRKSQ